MDSCQVDGCTRTVSKPGHALCLEHWKAERRGDLTRCQKCQRWHEKGAACSVGTQAFASEDDSAESGTGFLSSTRIGKHLGLSNIRINLILAELGWIEKYVKGWVPTDRGNSLGANVKEMRNGTPFVVWPESILKNAAFRESVAELTNVVAGPSAATVQAKRKADDFRSKFPANYYTQDGHHVRSKAEVLIDNWLYQQGIAHAYERRLPIEEDCYCDFYIPKGKGVYIEYWGLESDPKYQERKTAKLTIYAKHKLQLIELGDAEIERLDDTLPRMLLKFGIESV